MPSPAPASPADNLPGQSELARLCRTALEQVARAERFTMAEWLNVRPDGRTMKAAYAEAARLACELSVNTDDPAAPRSAGVPPAMGGVTSGPTVGRDARAPRERGRRPVLVLTRELRQCLERIAARLKRGDPLPAGAEEDLAAVEALLSDRR